MHSEHIVTFNDNSERFYTVESYSRSTTIKKRMVAFLSCFLHSQFPRVFYLYFLFLPPYSCFFRCFMYPSCGAVNSCQKQKRFLLARTIPCVLYPLTQIEPPYCENPCGLPAVKSPSNLCHVSTVGKDFKIILCSAP
jgi:hypothetical protein